MKIYLSVSFNHILYNFALFLVVDHQVSFQRLFGTTSDHGLLHNHFKQTYHFSRGCQLFSQQPILFKFNHIRQRTQTKRFKIISIF